MWNALFKSGIINVLCILIAAFGMAAGLASGNAWVAAINAASMGFNLGIFLMKPMIDDNFHVIDDIMGCWKRSIEDKSRLYSENAALREMVKAKSTKETV